MAGGGYLTLPVFFAGLGVTALAGAGILLGPLGTAGTVGVILAGVVITSVAIDAAEVLEKKIEKFFKTTGGDLDPKDGDVLDPNKALEAIGVSPDYAHIIVQNHAVTNYQEQVKDTINKYFAGTLLPMMFIAKFKKRVKDKKDATAAAATGATGGKRSTNKSKKRGSKKRGSKKRGSKKNARRKSKLNRR